MMLQFTWKLMSSYDEPLCGSSSLLFLFAWCPCRLDGGEIVATILDHGVDRLPTEKLAVRGVRVYASALSPDQIFQVANISSVSHPPPLNNTGS
jgi:hypothetical protein